MSGEIAPAVGDFPAGARVASYKIEQLIGRGGMAVVYRASDVRLDRQVALKILSPELARDDAFRQRFILESRSAAAVDHPNVIPVFEAGEADGVLFIAMRYVGGQDVRALVEREGKLPAARAVNIVTQVAAALDAAHAHGLVHRDVKPANMLISAVGDGRSPDHVYLSDFGLSKHSLATSSLTGTGQFLGTLDYMSPEQVEGRAIDGRTDLYALGCAAFEMLAGDPPFRREQNLAVMWAQVSAPPPSVRRWRPELSPDVDRVIAKALAKSPAERHRTCLEFARELGAACAIAPAELAEPVMPATPAAPPTELARGAAPVGSPPVHGAALIGLEQTVTENAPSGVRAPGRTGAGGPGGPIAPGSRHPGFAPTDPGARQAGAAADLVPTAQQYHGGPGYQPSARPPKRRSKAMPLLFGLMVIIGLVGAGLLVLHLRSSHNPHGPTKTTTITITPTHTATRSATSTPTSPPPPGPAAVVTDFIHAINTHHYHRAYALSQVAQSQGPYYYFVQRLAGTKHDYLTITSVSNDVVTIDLVAAQTDGTSKHYQGTYTVQNGVIVAANIVQLSG